MLSRFIAGCAGPVLSADEAAFFSDARPSGFILFARNCERRDQVLRLTDAVRAAIGSDDVLIAVDQEGGRVQRLGPPQWRALPPAAAFAKGTGTAGRGGAVSRAQTVARLVAADLRAVGINTNCVPVLDIPVPGAHDIIGTRAYGDNVETVATFGSAVAEGHMCGGVVPVMKHVPGHGRARADSHLGLARLDTSRAELSASDFLPFAMLNGLPAAMTAHIVYDAIDAQEPASTSRTVIGRIVRGEIGFEGLLMSDDLSMKALDGTLAERTERVLDAGCDIALHCNGNLDEMKLVAGAARPLDGLALARFERAMAITRDVQPFEVTAGEVALEEVMQHA